MSPFNYEVMNLIGLAASVNTAFPELRATIAGGAVRDAILGKPIRDIDMFVEDAPDLDVLGSIFGVKFSKFEHEFDYNEDEDRKSQIVAVWHGEGEGNVYGVDIIQVDDIEQRIDEFPDNISQVYIDARGLTLMPEFINGHMHKRMTYRDSAGTDRLLKLIDKFPDYGVVHV